MENPRGLQKKKIFLFGQGNHEYGHIVCATYVDRVQTEFGGDGGGLHACFQFFVNPLDCLVVAHNVPQPVASENKEFPFRGIAAKVYFLQR